MSLSSLEAQLTRLEEAYVIAADAWRMAVRHSDNVNLSQWHLSVEDHEELVEIVARAKARAVGLEARIREVERQIESANS